MIPTYSTSLRNRLSSFVSPAVKELLVARIFLGPNTGRLIRSLRPTKNVKGLRFDFHSSNMAVGEVPNLYFNRRERAELDFVRRHVIPSPITNVIELGTSIGFIACNIVYDKKVRFFGFEASPRLTEEARANLANNNRSGSEWSVENYCIDYSGNKHVDFAQESDSLVGRVGSGGSAIRVKAATFGELLRACDLNAEFALIADIEGAEAELLFNDADSLQSCALMVAELEDTPVYSIDDQAARAQAIGFELVERFRNVFAFRRRSLRNQIS